MAATFNKFRNQILVLFFIFLSFSIYSQEPFIITWTVGAHKSIKIPTEGSGYDYTVDFGDGTVLTNLIQDVTHYYENPGTYTVTISGDFPRIYFRKLSEDDAAKLTSIEQWGDQPWQSMQHAFDGCKNLVLNASDRPDLTNVSDMSYMFRNCSNLNQSVNHWDVSNVTHMEGLFAGAEVFNQPLHNWDVSNVTVMTGMFWNAMAFNQPLNDWNVSSVTQMNSVFRSAESFNQPLNNWDVSHVTTMTELFMSAAVFNQPLNNWDVSKVQDMSYMFWFAKKYDQPMEDWDVSSVTNMGAMFYSASDFNQPLETWDVSNVTQISTMFNDATSFNQPLNTWDVSNVTSLASMFNRAISFNHPLNNWDVSKVTSMNSMFKEARSFNQPLDNWDVSQVVDMRMMFKSATVFNQSLNNWDVSQLEYFSEMFSYAVSFNQPLDSWNTENVHNMSRLFNGASSFNQSINSWDISGVKDLSALFYKADSFNQPLNNWDVSDVEKMNGMFGFAASFNQPLDNWDVSSVREMEDLFYWASSFNQDISMWEFREGVIIVDLYSRFVSQSGLDVYNYDALLERMVTVNPYKKKLGASTLLYCNINARNELINNGWIITGDALSPDCNTISGRVLYDYNANGCDAEDPGVNDFMVKISDDDHQLYTFTQDGLFNVGILGSVFEVAVVDFPSYLNVAPEAVEVVFENSNTEFVDFCVTANQTIEDLNITILPTSETRPGFDSSYQIIVQNKGTQYVPEAEVRFLFDETAQTFLNANPAPVSQIADELVFELFDLAPFAQKVITLEMSTFSPPIVNAYDILHFTAHVMPDTNDYTPEDNTFEFEQIVVNSMDPNDKLVLEGEEIYLDEVDNYLNYIIRFQNTGTADAIRVRIQDTLHSKLDWSTLKPLAASHEYHIEIKNERNVSFIFENINLPPESVNEPDSHGYVAFKIKPLQNVEIGDVITGNAAIYFDFNEPIITNMVSTTIVDRPLSTERQADLIRQMYAYPNPAQKQLYLFIPESVNVDDIRIYSLDGREISGYSIDKNRINIENLSSGMYFLNVRSDYGNKNIKFIKY